MLGEDRQIGPSVFPVLLVNFIGTLGLSIVIPFLVFLVRDWGGNALMYGIIASTYPAFQMIGAPILGRMSDVIGRRKVLLISQVGTLISWLIFAVAFFVTESEIANFATLTLTVPLLVVFLARALDGLTGGNVSVANAYLADVSTDENRSRNFGWMAVAANAGFIVGPALAGLLGATSLGELAAVLAAAVISLVACLTIWLILPESNPCLHVDGGVDSLRRTVGQEHKDCIKANEKLSWSELIQQPRVPMMLILYFLIFLAFNVYYTAFPNHAVVGLRWSVAQTGAYFAVLSAMMVVVQGPVLQFASKRVTAAKLVVFGGLIMGVSFGLLMISDDYVAYASAVLFALGNGLMWPSYMALLAKTGPRDAQGGLQGLAGSIGGFASIIGLISGGVLYSALGKATFVVAALIIVTAAVVSIRLSGIFSASRAEATELQQKKGAIHD